MATSIEGPVELHQFTPSEEAEVFDRAARRYFRMSGDEFLVAWKTGQMKDADHLTLTRVLMLVPGGQ